MKRKNNLFRRTAVLLITLTLIIMLSTAAAASTNRFNDINGHWAYKFIAKWAEADMAAGYTDGYFRPNSNISKAEFYTWINSMIKVGVEREFKYKDISSIAKLWYTPILMKMESLNINISNADGYVRAASPLTRQEAAMIIIEVFQLKNIDFDYTAGYTDTAGITDQQKTIINTMRANHIMEGYANGSFSVNDYLTRAQALVVLNNCVGTLIQNESEWSSNTTGNLFIQSGLNKLSDCTISGTVYIANSMHKNELVISNTVIEKDLVIFGCKNVMLDNVIIKGEIVINDPYSDTNIGTKGETKVNGEIRNLSR